MSELVKWILGDLFHFLGAVILLSIVLSGLADIVRAARGRDVMLRLHHAKKADSATGKVP